MNPTQKPNFNDGHQCPYLDGTCEQDKKGICIFDYNTCLSYQQINVIEKGKAAAKKEPIRIEDLVNEFKGEVFDY